MKIKPTIIFCVLAALFITSSFSFAQISAQKPTISELNQYKSDGQTEIEEGDTTNEDTVVFKSKVTSPSSQQVKLQIEMKEYDQPFNEQDLIESDLVPSGTTASITRYGLIDAQYHWRARVIDNQGNKSTWQEYGTQGNVDFEVLKATTIKVAVILAEPYDVPHISNPITEQPCKLIPQKTYQNGHGKEYFEDLAYCVKDYHRENSYGKINLEFEIYNNGEWYKITDETRTERYYADGREDEFVQDAILLSGIDQGEFDVIAVVHAGESKQLSNNGKMTTKTWTIKFHPLSSPPYKIIIAEKDKMGFMAHEIGHILGAIIAPENTIIPDLSSSTYPMGFVERWDLMARGSWNKNNQGNDPPHMSSYTKEFLQWLNEDIHSKSAYGEYWVNSLETSKYGDSIFRYNLVDNTLVATPIYYILEARKRNNTWDHSLPGISDRHLVLYYIDTKGYSEYGYSNGGAGIMNNQLRTVTIPGNSTASINININDGILSPTINETYRDFDNLVKFTAITDRNTGNKYEIRARIEEIKNDSLNNVFLGAVLKPLSSLQQNVIIPVLDLLNNPASDNSAQKKEAIISVPPRAEPTPLISIISILALLFFVPLLVLGLFLLALYKVIISKSKSDKKKRLVKIVLKILWIINFTLFISIIISYIFGFILKNNKEQNIPALPGDVISPLLIASAPDLDLHLYCQDGKHIGINYQTGEFENQIPDSIVSGDNQGSPEWIFIPENITNCKYYVSSYDNQKFLEENPDIASQLSDTTDSYDLYARYIDPSTDIYTSPVITNQEINPGQNIFYDLEGTSDIKAYKEIHIDIKPNSFPNSINISSKGVVPVAILTTPTFDVKDVNINSVVFAGAIPVKSSIEDIDNDGDLDLVLHFDMQSLQLSPTDTEATLIGEHIKGTDSVKILSNNKKTSFLNNITATIHEVLFER